MNLTDRPLNTFESILYKIDCSSPFNILIDVQFNSCIDLRGIEQALESTKRSHFYLNYYLGESSVSDCPHFLLTEKPIRVESYSNLSQSERKHLLHREINTTSKYKDYPLVKVITLQNNHETEIILKISHVISDGISAYGLVKEIIQNMCMIATHSVIVPALMETTRPDVTLFPEWKTRKLGTSTHHWPTSRIAIPIDQRSTHIIEIDLPSDISEDIFHFCKKQMFSVNSLLMACLIKAMAGKLKEMGNFVPLKTSSGLDLRKNYEATIHNNNLGCWAGFGYLFYDLGSQIKFDISIDELATLYQNQIHTSLKSNTPFFHLNSLVKLYENESIENISSLTSSSVPYVLLTNIGKIELPETIALESSIKRVGLLTPMHRNWINDLGFGICASTTNNSLHLNLCYMSPAWKEQDAQEFSQTISTLLKKAVHEYKTRNI